MQDEQTFKIDESQILWIFLYLLNKYPNFFLKNNMIIVSKILDCDGICNYKDYYSFLLDKLKKENNINLTKITINKIIRDLILREILEINIDKKIKVITIHKNILEESYKLKSEYFLEKEVENA